MRKQLSYILTGLFFSLSVSGCGDNLAAPETVDKVVPITFNSGVDANAGMDVQTKAETTAFPNRGSIAIVAANASSTVINAGGWAESNLYINHVPATAGTFASSSYPVTINSGIAYWPFNPDEYLTFAAYSPAQDATLKRKKDITSLGDTELQVEVNATNQKFSDLLYSTPTNVWNKTSNGGAASLTEFKHAMARLVVKVIGVDKDWNEIKDYNNAANLAITKLTVCTKVTKGVFDFVTPDWTLTAPEASAAFHTLHTFTLPNNGKLPYDSSNEEVYILPSTTALQTVELSKIEFQIKDAVLTYGDVNGYPINNFKTGTTPATLEMGKTTILTFKVRVMEISTGDTDNIVLEGTLAPWNYKGNSSVVIE